MKSKEFTLNLNAAHELRSKLGKINLLFPDVTIKFEDSSTKHRTKIEWITLEAQTDEIISNAKNYITSFTNPASTVSVESPPGFNNKLLRNNESLLCALQRSCCAYIAIKSDTHVCIQGIDDTTVALARSLIDNEIKVFKKNPEIKEDKAIEINSHVHNFCLKLGYTDGEMQVAAHECNKNNIPINENTLLLELMKRNPHKVKENAMKRSVERITKSVGEMTTNETTNELRDIVIDGSNVAMGHGNKQIFSCRGIQIAVDWFRTRGHKNIFVFVPQFRLEASTPTRPICDQNILKELEQEKVIVFTPSRKVNGRRVVSYDDRIFVKYAYENDCIIVSNDNFRDLAKENGDWQTFIEHHLLMYSFVHDCFMPPDDPLGKYGPTLDEYLKKQTSYNKQPCPFKNKCTYGAKCKYYHANQSPQPAIPKQSIMQPVLARGAADPPTMKLSLAPEQPPKMQQQIRKRETNMPTTNYNDNTQHYQQHYNQQQQYMRSQQQPYGQSMQFQNVQAYYNIQGNQQPSFYQPQQQTNMAYMERYPPQRQQMAYYNNDPRQQYANQSGGYYPPVQQQATKSNYERLLELFPGQTKSIHNAIRMNPTETNLDMLISKVVAQLP